jgi:hypothetical protein
MRLLLIHGMGRTPLSLALFGRRLSQQGHQVGSFGDQPNDGVVAVEETRLGGNTEVILVPAVHTLIMNAPQVARILCELLKT